MAKRPHGDVERTQEDLDVEFYAGIAQMRLEAGREMQRWGYRPQIILPLPLFLPPPSVPARVLPGAEALAAASYATVVQAVRDLVANAGVNASLICDLVANASSPAARAASSSAPAMLDGTASGQDAGTGEAPVPDLNTASGQDAAPVPDLNTASGQDAAPRPERDTASDQDAPPHPERDTASDQDAPPHPDRGTASGQDAPPHPDRDTASGQVAPAQDADVQAAAPETEECIYWKDNCWWKDRGREQRQRDLRNWMWQDANDKQWYANWQAPWSGTWSGASWSARGNWQEGRWDSSMDE